ncbi:MAG TPA: hypothetical protein VHG30_05345 [Microvirga sp.]|nr:hypothetical protein [Microvirga sp.]
MSLNSNVRALLAATVFGGAALLATAPAQASDFDDEFGPSYHRPRVEREVTVTTITRRHVYDGPVYGRPAFDEDEDEPRYRRRHFEHRPYAQPVFYARPVYGRPVFDDDCRLIVKKRVNAWGDVVIKRIKRCG